MLGFAFQVVYGQTNLQFTSASATSEKAIQIHWTSNTNELYEVDYADSLKRSNLVKYARVGGDVDAVITDFKNLNPFLVPSYGLEGNNSGGQLIAFVKLVQQKGGMGIFMFHGIGGDYISVSAKAHQQLITYLKQHKKDIWIRYQMHCDWSVHALKLKILMTLF